MADRALEIVATPGPAWVQDAGRPGRAHEGVPPGGALVPAWLAAANRAVGNPPGAAAVECFGPIVVAARGDDLVVGWEGAAAVLPRDHVRTLAPTGAVAYLAVGGGLDVPIVLGGRGLLVAAGLGGGFGRPLMAGDRLRVGGVATEAGGALLGVVATEAGGALLGVGGAVPFDPDAPLRVVPGPDLDTFAPGALERFVVTEWLLGAGDRVGVRLLGPSIPRLGGDRAPSAPMVRGAVQVPAGGGPVVLGPDHPTTGGYPVLAVVARADHGALAARARGARVRFVPVTPAEARNLK